MLQRSYDVVIVGGGPAGLATALHLARVAPDLAERTLILEAAQHPRRKVCGGAITFHGVDQLAALGLSVDVPTARVHRLRFRCDSHTFTTDSRDAMHVVQREAFDASLAAAVQRRGLALRSGERLLGLRAASAGVELTTDQGSYVARAVVGADGANSVVRRALGLREVVGVARLLRAMTPVERTTTPEFTQRMASFDFSCMAADVQGYVWDFPCLVDGQPYLNRGIFDSRIAAGPRADLKAAFAASLGARGVAPEAVRLEGHPVRWFNPQATFARPHALLVGDAAGVDPLFAEGISYALEYGALAAAALADAFARRDFSFADYRARLLRHDLGQILTLKATVARWLYGARSPRLRALFWWLAAVAPRWMQHWVGQRLRVIRA